MTKVCPICEKGSQMGGGYSNRVRATQFNPTGSRKRKPNLQWATPLAKAGQPTGKRIKICTSCIKSGQHLK